MTETEEPKEMQTDDSNQIASFRRDEIDLFDIISEICGNVGGTRLYMNVVEGVLYIYHNDGGLSSEDKLAIVYKYKSAKKNNTTKTV